jgi:hypothetical protein
VLWFAPSDTIRKQTADAFKTALHPYREELDRQFAGRVVTNLGAVMCMWEVE